MSGGWQYLIDRIGRQRPMMGAPAPGEGFRPGNFIPTGFQPQQQPMATGGQLPPMAGSFPQTGGVLPPQQFNGPQFPMQTGGPGQMTRVPQWQTGGGNQPQQVRRFGNVSGMLDQFNDDPGYQYAFGRGTSYR